MGGQYKGRRSKRLADMSIQPDDGDFLDQFAPDELDEDRVDLDLGPEARCIQTFLSWHNRPVWFSIVVQVLEQGQWRTVIRADTCHYEAHIHRFARGRRAEVRRQALCEVASIEDVERGFDHACDLLLNDWEENVRRWRADGR